MTRRALLLAVASVAVAATTWPLATLTASTGIDPSWRVALHLTWTRSIHFGDGFTWTYGPLGFLAFPIAVSGGTLVAGFLFVALVQVALCYLLVRRGTAAFGVAAGIVAAFLAIGLPFATPAALLLVELALAVAALEAPNRWFPYAGGAVAGLTLLVKTNSGAAALAIAVVAAAALGVRRAAAAVATAAATFLVGWIATGNSLGAVPGWLRLSGSIVAGYSSAMQYEQPGPRYEYPLAAAAVVVVLAAAAVAGAAVGRTRGAALVLVAGGFCFAEFKEGFVRHDATHSAPFFASIAIAAVIFAGRTRLLAAAGLAVAIYGVHRTDGFPYAPGASLRAVVSQVGNVAAPHRLVEASREAERRSYEVPSRLLAELRGRTVHVDPFETAAISAYRLRWRPLPVLQAYSAYTSTLDDSNASALASPAAPDRVLRENAGAAVGGRTRELEAPAEFRALLCNYVQLGTGTRWQVLSHVPDRCGTPHVLAVANAASGQSVTVPDAAPQNIVVARIHLHDPLGNRVRALLYKPRTPTVWLGGAPPAQLVAATAADGIVVHVPGATGLDPRFGGAIDWRTVTVSTVDRRGVRIEFDAYPVFGSGPPARGERSIAPLPRFRLAGGRVTTANGASLELGEGGGYVEYAYDRRGELVLHGWAGDAGEGYAAARILVFADDTLVFAGRPNERRPDVVQETGHPLLDRSGFTILVPLRDVRTAEARRHVRVVSLVRGRALAAAYLPAYGWR